LPKDDGLIEQAPKFKGKRPNAMIKSEKDRKRDRVASDAEYQALLDKMRRSAQRVLIALYESAMRPGEVIKFPWEFVDLKADDGERVQRFHPLVSFIREGKKNRTNRVFTRNGRPMKSIRTAFEFAIEKAAIEDLRLHDFRHTCITRWAANGVLQQAIMAAAGHHSIPQNLAYTNLQPTDVKNAFKLATPVQQKSSLENASAASY
jgi:integrase